MAWKPHRRSATVAPGCRYYAYIPDPLAHLELSLPVELTADISDAERDIEHLNTETPALVNLEALARLLLRAESVASSRIEGLEVGPRRLAKYEAAQAAQLADARDSTASAVLGNIRAMTYAIEAVAQRAAISVDDLVTAQRILFEDSSDDTAHAGALRSVQNWMAEARTAPVAPTSCPHHPSSCTSCSMTSASTSTMTDIRRWSRRR